MKFISTLLLLAAALAQEFDSYDSLCGCGGCGYGGWGGYGGCGFGGLGCGYGRCGGCGGCGGCGYGGLGYGGYGGYGYPYGGWGFGVLSGSELSDYELDSLCCGDYASDYGYDMDPMCCGDYMYDCCSDDDSDSMCCAPCGMGSMGACGPMASGCGPMMGASSFAPSSCGAGSYAPARFAPMAPAAQPMMVAPMRCAQPVYSSNNAAMNNRAICGYANDNCANVRGSGMRNCGYNQGNICGQVASGRLNANACNRAGNRAFARKCADEFLVRRCNEGVSTGNDCYNMADCNVCARAGRLAGNRACGNANNCYSNDAGMNCRNMGIAGNCNSNCCRAGRFASGGCAPCC